MLELTVGLGEGPFQVWIGLRWIGNNPFVIDGRRQTQFSPFQIKHDGFGNKLPKLVTTNLIDGNGKKYLRDSHSHDNISSSFIFILSTLKLPKLEMTKYFKSSSSFTCPTFTPTRGLSENSYIPNLIWLISS